MKNYLIFAVLLQITNCFHIDPINFDDQQNITARLETIFENNIQIKTEINETCRSDILLFLDELKMGKEWALKMLDASSKSQSGVLEGNTENFGFFDECLGINENVGSTNILGKYCLLRFDATEAISNTASPIRTSRAVCLPSACSITDIDVFLKQFNVHISQPDTSCQTRDTFTFDSESLAITIFFGCVLTLLIVSTIYDVVTVFIYKEKSHILFSAFSVLTNAKKLFTVTQGDRDISCIYGIRVFSIAWVMLLHLYYPGKVIPTMNQISVDKDYKAHNYDFAIGGSKAVDTFLLLSGLMVSYVFLANMEKRTFNLFVFYMHRYLRLTPALGAVIVVSVGLIQFFSSGPTWLEVFSIDHDACVTNWWKIILYLNNYYGFSPCVIQSWYLAVDMQLYILAPIILLLLHKKTKIGLSLSVFLLVCIMTNNFVLTWMYDFGSAMILNKNLPLYFSKYYKRTYTRASPWLIGIIAGYVIHKKKQSKTKITINPLVVTLLWIVSLVILLCGFFVLESYDRNWEMKLMNCLYNSFAIPLWSLAISWIIFACHFGYGGFVNWFLSLPLFQVLSRLSYANFLIHYIIINMYLGRIRSPIHYSNYDNLLSFWGIYVYTQFASILLTLAFEYPILVFEKLLFTRNSRKVDNKTPTQS